jgi:hypothetical protein
MIKKEKKRRRWWRTELYRKRVGNEFMQDLKFQHVSGHYKNFTRMSPTDFDKLLTMIGPKISKKILLLVRSRENENILKAHFSDESLPCNLLPFQVKLEIGPKTGIHFILTIAEIRAQHT